MTAAKVLTGLKEPTLLDKAKAYGKAKKIGHFVPTEQDVELGIAWAKGEIGLTQVCVAYARNGKKIPTSESLQRLAYVLRHGFRIGRIKG